MGLLTKQELLITELIASGFTEKEIASKLFISVNTVATHTRSIRKKLDAKNIADVTRKFILNRIKSKIMTITKLSSEVVVKHNKEGKIMVTSPHDKSEVYSHPIKNLDYSKELEETLNNLFISFGEKF